MGLPASSSIRRTLAFRLYTNDSGAHLLLADSLVACSAPPYNTADAAVNSAK